MQFVMYESDLIVSELAMHKWLADEYNREYGVRRVMVTLIGIH